MEQLPGTGQAERALTFAGDRDRLAQLVQAGIALSSELSLDALLRLTAETAAAVTGARYAALGVLDEARSGLTQFVTVGIDEETRARIGTLPRGRGILGALIADARPLRLRALGEDPRSVGFPPGHPPMSSFLGVPIRLRGAVYGNLYLTEKDGGEFNEADEELVMVLAGQAAVAIENARLYQSATRWLRERESVDELMNELVSEPDLGRLLMLVAVSLRELIGARSVSIWLPTPEGTLEAEAVAGDPVDLVAGVTRIGDGKLAAVFARGRPERVDSVLDDREIDQSRARRLALSAGLWAPLLVQGRAVGVIACYDRQGSDPRFSDHDLLMCEALAARAAVAVELRQRLSRDSVRSLLAAQEQERKRLARELHDQTGQALTALLLALKRIEPAIGDEEAVTLRQLVNGALEDVRRLALELRPAALDDFGLVPALERLVAELDREESYTVQLEAALSPGERLADEHETVLYRISQEALTNIVKHANATQITIQLDRSDGAVTLTVEDNGGGFDPAAIPDGHLGLRGMRERVELLAGTLTLQTHPGHGTRLQIELPLTEPAPSP